MQDSGYIDICKASVHNLKGISLRIPRHALVVITGLSGSGKSSLAFDTIYAEARRRYMDTLSAYARHYIGVMERPEVESIDGLSPTIAIEQKSTNRNPRSTVGTITEISDFLRLLYARASTAYSPVTGKPMVKYTDSGIVDLIMKEYAGRKCIILAPLVKGRKGHYRELFDSLLKKGLSYARIDGEIRPLGDMASGVDRYKVHFIEAVIDRVVPKEEDGKRIRASVLSALTQGKGSLMILDPETGEVRHFSKHFICPDSGISFPEPAPHTFSFNSPAGACPVCNGLGTVREVDMAKIVPDPSLSIADGGIVPLGKKRDNAVFTVLEAVARKYGFSLFDPIKDIPQETMNIILNGSEDLIRVDTRGGLSEMITFPGLLSRFEGDDEEEDDSVASRYSSEVVCPECHGKRLRKDSLCFKIGGLDIAEVSDMDVSVLYDWVGGLKDKLDPRGQAVAADIVKELRERIGFLVDVGLSYLSLSRSTMSLSGGESQRIRLATQIGSKLVNVLYILDEPSIGLHQSDNIKLINSLRRLRDEGGQYGHGRGARRGDDAQCGLDRGHRSWRGREGRRGAFQRAAASEAGPCVQAAGGSAGHRQGGSRGIYLRVPQGNAADRGAVLPPSGQREADHSPRGLRQQSQGRGHQPPARLHHRHQRSQRQRQVFPDQRHPHAGHQQPALPLEIQGAAVPGIRGIREHRQARGDRPVSGGPFPALQPRDLHRRAHLHPQSLRRDSGCQDPRFQVQ